MLGKGVFIICVRGGGESGGVLCCSEGGACNYCVYIGKGPVRGAGILDSNFKQTRDSGFKFQKCNLTLPMSPTCHSNSPIPIYCIYSGFTKTFCNSLDILTDEAGVLRRTFRLFVGHY